MLESSRGSYTQYVASICILLICSISYWLCKEIRFCAACTVAMDMCITLCYKRTYPATIIIYSLVDGNLIWRLSESYKNCQIRCMPFIDPFQYTASMGFFPYGAQNCRI